MTEPQPFSAGPVLGGLTGFQRNTVEHIIDRFYGPNPTDRFLVADETGLGKTIVARGVIARTIEELQTNDAVDRIDIVYVCSNLDLAHQNLHKLNVTGDDHHGIASRLTLLAKHARRFSPSGASRFTKPVNLVSFTPGTSFSKGWRSGTAEERAMIYLLLEGPLGLADDRRAHNARRVLQGSLQAPERLVEYVRSLRWELNDQLDPLISEAFLKAAGTGTPSLLDEFEDLVEHYDDLEKPLRRSWPLVGELRAVLARESVRLLTPDLVILDEFQRFRELLNENTEAGELAHHLFQFRDQESDHRAKVLLLSATPFKPFTYAEEATVGDDHHRDFLEVVKFLANGDETGTTRRIADALSDYRSAVVTGRAASNLTDNVRAQLLQVMTRNERPRSVTAQMSQEHSTELDIPPEEDLLGFVALKQLARHLNAPFSIEYWKSAPYFVNFMDGYKIADRLRTALDDHARAASVQTLLDRTQRIDFDAVRRYEPVGLGNARMRALAAATVEQGWWKLLWVPPSLPYLVPGGPFAALSAQNVTKRLIFSSWTATPTAVASLLSYEADRLGAGGKLGTTPEERVKERNSRRSRLAYRLDREGDRDRPSSMSTLAIFWPMPGLAALADPRRAEFHRSGSVGDLAPHDLHATIAERLRSEHRAQPAVESTGPTASHWFEALRRPDSVPENLTFQQIQDALSGASDAEDDRAEQAEDAVVHESDDGPRVRQSFEFLARVRELSAEVCRAPRGHGHTRQCLERRRDHTVLRHAKSKHFAYIQHSSARQHSHPVLLCEQPGVQGDRWVAAGWPGRSRPLGSRVVRQLGPNCVVLANVRITDPHKDHEADLVVLMPDSGIVVVEVKGSHVWVEDGAWFIQRDDSPDRIGDPLPHVLLRSSRERRLGRMSTSSHDPLSPTRDCCPAALSAHECCKQRIWQRPGHSRVTHVDAVAPTPKIVGNGTLGGVPVLLVETPERMDEGTAMRPTATTGVAPTSMMVGLPTSDTASR